MSGKIKLLVVDDEVHFLEVISKRLSMRDFDVTAVTSGQEAVDLADKQEFDLALIDLRMPGMSGEEVLEILKRKHPFIEVIILTGHGSVESAVSCIQAGSCNFLQKPAETSELIEVLKDAYQKRVQRKLKMSARSLEQLMSSATRMSALGILRKLRKLENNGA
jgi:DNA-binding NtrC family response regulator